MGVARGKGKRDGQGRVCSSTGCTRKSWGEKPIPLRSGRDPLPCSGPQVWACKREGGMPPKVSGLVYYTL